MLSCPWTFSVHIPSLPAYPLPPLQLDHFVHECTDENGSLLKECTGIAIDMAVKEVDKEVAGQPGWQAKVCVSACTGLPAQARQREASRGRCTGGAMPASCRQLPADSILPGDDTCCRDAQENVGWVCTQTCAHICCQAHAACLSLHASTEWHPARGGQAEGRSGRLLARNLCSDHWHPAPTL